MHLVDDVDAIAPALRRILDLLAQVADLIHAVVGRRVDLDDVQAVFRLQRLAGGARAAGLPALGPLAVDGPGEHLGRRGLARAAAAAEQIGVGDAAGLHLIAQRGDDVFLPDEVVEARGTPLTIERLIRHMHKTSL